MTGPLASTAPQDTRRAFSGRRRRSSSRQGVARSPGAARTWPDVLETPVAHRRREIAAVCAGVLAGWAGLIGVGFTLLA